MPYFGQNIQRAPFKGSPTLRDFQHASKTFRSNGYALAPKMKFLYHTYFEVNPRAYNQNLSTGDNFGLLVKSVKLPSYQISTHELNQYNRKRIVQTKIKYNNVNITFHDDSDNTITSLWEAYYTYYYKDGTNFNIFKGDAGTATNGITRPTTTTLDPNFDQRNLYSNGFEMTGKNNWGYVGEIPGQSIIRKDGFFKTITIFGFNRHLFTAYTLINPMISSFTHDTYAYSEGGGTMEMQMEIQYETVVYNEGAMDGREPSNIVTGFGLQSSYDRTPSPITPPNNQGLVPGNGSYVSADGGYVGGTGAGGAI